MLTRRVIMLAIGASGRSGGEEATLSSILVVDDESLIRWSLKERLGQAGYRVVLAENGREARGHFEEEISLVLLDLRLPDTDGLELAKEFKRGHPDCPVVLMTAYGSPEVARQAAVNGVCRVVDKPFSLDQMTRLVDDLLHVAPH